MYWIYCILVKIERDKKKHRNFYFLSCCNVCLHFISLNTAICTKSICLSTVVINCRVCIDELICNSQKLNHGFSKCDTVYMVVYIFEFQNFIKINVCVCQLELNFEIMSGTTKKKQLNCTFVILFNEFSETTLSKEQEIKLLLDFYQILIHHFHFIFSSLNINVFISFQIKSIERF